MNELFGRATWRKVLWAWLLSRIWVAAWVYAGHLNHPFREKMAGGYEGVSNWWLNAWTAFDSGHYLRIAQEGYNSYTIAWLPLYPSILQLAGPHENAMALWGIVVSNVAFAFALCLFYRLTKIDVNERIATVAVWVLAFFPTSAFFSAVYTESLFLLFITSAFWCARNRSWAWAGAWGLYAACTRNSGAVVFAALLAAYFWDYRSQETARERLKVLWLALPMVAFGAIQLAHSQRYGPLAGIISHRLNFRNLDWPFVPIWRDVLDIAGGALDLTTLLNFVFTLLAFAALFGRRKLPLSHALFVVGVMAMHLIYPRFIPPYTISSVRYLSTTFPFVQRLAEWIDTLLGNRFRLVLVSILYAAICALQSFLFGEKAYLG